MQVAVTYHLEEGTWWADSEDVPGFYAAGRTLLEVRELVRSGLAFQLEVADLDDLDLREAREDGSPVFHIAVTAPDLTWASGWQFAGVSEAAKGDTPAPGTTTHGNNRTLITA